jgi:hypothetical protein
MLIKLLIKGTMNDTNDSDNLESNYENKCLKMLIKTLRVVGRQKNGYREGGGRNLPGKRYKETPRCNVP